MNPYEKFLLEKKAASFTQGMQHGLGNALVGGMATAAVGAGMTGLGMAASKIYNAVTQKHDFTQMMDLNPDLHSFHQENPKQFNQMFSTLRSMNPEFSRDPLVAGTYMRRMSESPLTAGGVAVEAIQHRPQHTPMSEAISRGGLEGARTGVGEGLKQGPQAFEHAQAVQHMQQGERMKATAHDWPRELARHGESERQSANIQMNAAQAGWPDEMQRRFDLERALTHARGGQRNPPP